MRGNVVAAICDTAVSNISIHASTWEATTSGLLSVCGNIFQFTPLHERQLKYICWLLGDLPYFNSRLYMRGNVAEALEKKSEKISIHASTWEATDATPAITWTQSISIHASTWEATISRDSIWLSVCYFNSRLYMRGNIVYFFLFLCL